MSKTPNYDAKVKAILDATKPGERVCELTGEKWVMTQTDIDRFRRFNVPPLQVSPKTFTKQYLALHTGYSWWWNTDCETGKPILTYMHPSRPYQVMNDEAWRQKDFSDRGRDLDIHASFFAQLIDLAKTVPMSAWKNTQQPINSIARISLGDENSYFMAGTQSKNCCFGTDSFALEDSMEVGWSSHITRCYNILRCQNMDRCIVARESRQCLECLFIFDCRDSEFCFFSWNRRHGKYLWRNEPLSKGEWEKRRADLDLGSFKTFDGLYREFQHALATDAVWPENFNIKSERCTGEYLINCVDVEHGWYSEGAKDCWWSIWGQLGSEGNALGIDIHGSGGFGNGVSFNSSACRFNWFVNRCQRVEYCIECDDCEDCFGCVGIRRKRFHILNKPYPEEDYWRVVDELKCAMLERGEYGAYLPQELAQTPFQHSACPVGFITSKEEQEKIGFIQFDPDADGAFGDWNGKPMHEVASLPDHIKDVEDVWVGRAIYDHALKRPYGILKSELEFYRRMNLPLRRGHFISLVEQGLWAELNMVQTTQGACHVCGKETVIAQNRTYPNRTIYCRACYLEYMERNG